MNKIQKYTVEIGNWECGQCCDAFFEPDKVDSYIIQYIIQMETVLTRRMTESLFYLSAWNKLVQQNVLSRKLEIDCPEICVRVMSLIRRNCNNFGDQCAQHFGLWPNTYKSNDITISCTLCLVQISKTKMGNMVSITPKPHQARLCHIAVLVRPACNVKPHQERFRSQNWSWAI